jgi:hypothetical protein
MLAELAELVDSVAELLIAVTADDADSLLVVVTEETRIAVDMAVLVRMRDRVTVARMALAEVL